MSHLAKHVFTKVVFMKKEYQAPEVKKLGSFADLTLTNQLDPFSDVPQGEIANTGNNPPPEVS